MSELLTAEALPEPQAAPLTPSRTACSILVEWANQQDHWVRGLVREVLSTRQELPEAALDSAYAAFLAEKGLSAETVEEVPPLPSAADTDEQIEPLILTSIGNIEGVNALAQNQTIEFNPRLTVVFGPNASGKTGYVRVLKSVANVRTVEPVLGNVNEGTSLQSKAQLTYRVGSGDVVTAGWNGESGMPPLTRINAFDSRAVTIHVDDDLSYTYTPRDLALFRHVADAINGVRQRLEAARSDAERTANPFLARFERGSTIYPVIEGLGAATDLQEIRKLATVAEEEAASIDGLRERVEALKSQSVQTKLQLAKSQVALMRKIERVASAISAFNDEAYTAEREAHLRAASTHRAITQEAFTSDHIAGVHGHAWQEMIEAAHRYAAETEHSEYPRAGERCVYCHQELGEQAVQLLLKYQQFCTAETRQAVDSARKALDGRQRSLAGGDLSELDSSLSANATLLDGHAQLISETPAFIELVRPVLTAVQNGDPIEFTDVRKAADNLRATAGHAAKTTEQLATDLASKSEERKQLLDRETAKLRDLVARQQLQQLSPEIERHVERAKWASRAGTFVSRFAPVQRSLTEATKDASEGLLNENFEARFREESRLLRAPAVKLDFQGRKGEPARRKRVLRHRLSEILSEGEQKVIALADFLAEATLRRTGAPIVFDDPVNSLDYKRMEHVVSRITQLAGDQQVIVFTHNIWFTALLLDAFEKRPQDVTYYDVKAEAGQVGVISKGTSPRVDTPSKIEKRMNSLLQDAAKQTGEMRDAAVERGYSMIRNWCEVFVEQELLQGVARRYEPNIRIGSLGKIRADRLNETVAVVEPIYEKACREIEAHSQPMETLSIRATLEDLKEDWQKLIDSRGAYMKK